MFMLIFLINGSENVRLIAFNHKHKYSTFDGVNDNIRKLLQITSPTTLIYIDNDTLRTFLRFHLRYLPVHDGCKLETKPF